MLLLQQVSGRGDVAWLPHVGAGGDAVLAARGSCLATGLHEVDKLGPSRRDPVVFGFVFKLLLLMLFFEWLIIIKNTLKKSQTQTHKLVLEMQMVEFFRMFWRWRGRGVDDKKG